MISRGQWLRMQLGKKLWIKSAGFALAGILLTAVGMALDRHLPAALFTEVDPNAARSILNILASSMLAVTTFSLSIMVAAFSGASNVSPRATDLLMADQTSHNILAIFVGAFLFSLVGLITLNLKHFDARDEFVLFLMSIAMVIAVVIAILRWVDHLTRFGRMGDTINRLEQVTLRALQDRLANPFLGGAPLLDANADAITEDKACAIYAADIGYVDFVDMQRLQDVATEHQCHIYLRALPGAFIHHGVPICHTSAPLDDKARASLLSACVIGHKRNFLQDPRFGVSVLAEVGSRALSSAINDTGTPIDIISRAVRILSSLAERETSASAAVIYPAVFVPPIAIDEYFDDFFSPIARDSANLIEVHTRLHKALHALEALGDRQITQSVQRYRAIALEYAEVGLVLECDKALVRKIAAASPAQLPRSRHASH